MKTTYPITPLQEQLLVSARRDLEVAQRVLNGCIAMAFAAVGVAVGNLADVKDGEMIVETPDPAKGDKQ